MKIKHFFDAFTYTLTYIVYDEVSKDAVVIDPVLNFDPNSSKLSTESLKDISEFLVQENLNLHFILETHAHADHITSSHALKQMFPNAKIGIGASIQDVQKTFVSLYNFHDKPCDGTQFDVLFLDEHIYKVGSINFKVLFTPGHTPACVSYLFDDALFTGDALFMPDYGCGRCDFPGGDAKQLYHSIHKKIYTLPKNTRIFVGHDYQPQGRALAYESSVADEMKHNIQIPHTISENDFINFRTQRDKTLSAPRLLWPSIQINIFGGQLPQPESNEKRYLKIPLF